MKFYQRTRELLKESHLTQKQFLQDLKLSHATMPYWKNGGTPNASTIAMIAAYFDVDPEYLTGESDIRRKSPPGPKTSTSVSDEVWHEYQLLSQEDQQLVNDVIHRLFKCRTVDG